MPAENTKNSVTVPTVLPHKYVKECLHGKGDVLVDVYIDCQVYCDNKGPTNRTVASIPIVLKTPKQSLARYVKVGSCAERVIPDHVKTEELRAALMSELEDHLLKRTPITGYSDFWLESVVQKCLDKFSQKVLSVPAPKTAQVLPPVDYKYTIKDVTSTDNEIKIFLTSADIPHIVTKRITLIDNVKITFGDECGYHSTMSAVNGPTARKVFSNIAMIVDLTKTSRLTPESLDNFIREVQSVMRTCLRVTPTVGEEPVDKDAPKYVCISEVKPTLKNNIEVFFSNGVSYCLSTDKDEVRVRYLATGSLIKRLVHNTEVAALDRKLYSRLVAKKSSKMSIAREDIVNFLVDEIEWAKVSADASQSSSQPVATAAEKDKYHTMIINEVDLGYDIITVRFTDLQIFSQYAIRIAADKVELFSPTATGRLVHASVTSPVATIPHKVDLSALINLLHAKLCTRKSTAIQITPKEITNFLLAEIRSSINLVDGGINLDKVSLRSIGELKEKSINNTPAYTQTKHLSTAKTEEKETAKPTPTLSKNEKMSTALDKRVKYRCTMYGDKLIVTNPETGLRELTIEARERSIHVFRDKKELARIVSPFPTKYLFGLPEENLSMYLDMTEECVPEKLDETIINAIYGGVSFDVRYFNVENRGKLSWRLVAFMNRNRKTELIMADTLVGRTA